MAVSNAHREASGVQHHETEAQGQWPFANSTAGSGNQASYQVGQAYSVRDQRAQVQEALRDRWATRSVLANRLHQFTSLNVSSRTLGRVLKKHGLARTIAAPRLLLIAAHRGMRLCWRKAHAEWIVEQRREVLWSDDKIIRTTSFRKGQHVTRRSGSDSPMGAAAKQASTESKSTHGAHWAGTCPQDFWDPDGQEIPAGGHDL